jgi:cytoskeletal protein CcmA (bactofilin family)
MFRRREESIPSPDTTVPSPTERITSVLSTGITWKGQLGGTGGVRIEGTFEGDVALRGLLVIGETGRVTCQKISADTVIVAGAVKGDITAEKVEIRSTGRVWGNVVTESFSTQEGAFLRGQITMEEEVEIDEAPEVEPEEAVELETETPEDDSEDASKDEE